MIKEIVMQFDNMPKMKQTFNLMFFNQKKIKSALRLDWWHNVERLYFKNAVFPLALNFISCMH